jgi:serine/threonine protein phosphatase 1
MTMLSRTSRQRPKGARGCRAYVIGDVHGRLDLLERLLAEIERDLVEQPSPKTLLVFLGDLIDRGPHSAQVIERLRTYGVPGLRTVFLLGNHEEVLLRILAGDAALITQWRWFGGAECLESYGVEPSAIAQLDDQAALEALRAAIPKEHAEFIGSFVDTCGFGDYLFVHAGIRPGVLVEEQVQSDLRWIREPFLLDDTDHGCVVVHGHTISEEIDERQNRIGIDTGAYRTGVLTALVIEGEQRRYLQTSEASVA